MFYDEIKYDIDYDRANQRWNAWGSRGHDFLAAERIDRILALLRNQLRLDELRPTPSVALEEVKVPATRLKARDIDALTKIVGKNGLLLDDPERIFHSAGQSYYDLIRLRTNDLRHFVDAVVYPANEKQIARLLAWARDNNTSVVPFGGGSSVVGGLEVLSTKKSGRVVSLDMTQMNALIHLDEESRLAEFEAGIYGPQIEKELNARGLTLGHFPQSFEYSTLGGWAAARSAGQQSNHYGSIHKIITSLAVVTTEGVIETVRVPSGATGPDMKEILIGSEGLLGVITRVTVKVHELPNARRYFGILFPDFEAGRSFIRSVSTHGSPLSMARLSDAEETRLFMLLAEATRPTSTLGPLKKSIERLVMRAAGMRDQKCLVVAGLEGTELDVNRGQTLARSIVREHGGFYVGEQVGRNWLRARFNMPFLRNHVMEHGVGIDTLETATTYDRVTELHDAVLLALKEAAGNCLAMCHLSHSYHDGACLYYTVIFSQDAHDPIGQWRRIKKKASDAVLKHGGNISHHHGVGADHRSWYQTQTGPLAIEALRAMKGALDPDNVLNPGKLFAP